MRKADPCGRGQCPGRTGLAEAGYKGDPCRLFLPSALSRGPTCRSPASSPKGSTQTGSLAYSLSLQVVSTTLVLEKKECGPGRSGMRGDLDRRGQAAGVLAGQHEPAPDYDP